MTSQLQLNDFISSDSLEEDEADDYIGYEQDTLIYDPEKINIITKEPTIEQLLRRINEQALDLAPDFQRHANLWRDDAKSRLIESIIIRIPLPAFYIDATNEDKWLVVDGIQRLYALKQFVTDKKLKLSGLEYLTHLKNKTFDELERRYQRRIEETQVTIYLIEKGTPPEIKYNIFKRINTGGLPLTPQELRQALNPGKGTAFLAKLARAQEFKRVLPLSSQRINRMDDREFILGFLSFLLTSYQAYPNDTRNLFLTRNLNKLSKMSNEELEDLEIKFIKTMKNAWEIFEKDAFRKPQRNAKKKYPINQSLFESWSVSLSQFSDRDIAKLKERKNQLLEKFKDYVEQDQDFEKSISQVAERVEYRLVKIKTIIEDVLND